MYRLIRGKGPEEVSEELATFLKVLVEDLVREKGVAKLGLAGGRSPKLAYSILSESIPYWERVLLFPTDERYVPSEDPKSNYRMLRESLGEKAKIYRVKTELPLREACEDFDRALSKAGPLDLILLGLGEDGHTASLFPGVSCLPCGENACTSKSPDGLDRISMSLSFINTSCRLAFLVLGEEKRVALEKLLRGEDIPASKVWNGGEILLFTDLEIHLPPSTSSFSISK